MSLVLVSLSPIHFTPAPRLDLNFYLSNLEQAEAGEVVLRGMWSLLGGNIQLSKRTGHFGRNTGTVDTETTGTQSCLHMMKICTLWHLNRKLLQGYVCLMYTFPYWNVHKAKGPWVCTYHLKHNRFTTNFC